MYSSNVEASCSNTTSAPDLAISCAWPQGFPLPKRIFQVITRSVPPPPLPAAGAAVANEAEGTSAAVGDITGGCQPPPWHVQSGPGRIVVQPAVVGAGAATSVAGTALAGTTIPGGYQPPPAHVHPGPGCTLVQMPDGTAGVELGAGSTPGIGIPGGSQPPPEQIQPGPGRTVVHSSDAVQLAPLPALASTEDA